MYLTSDADEVIEDIDPDKIYVIGGIADPEIRYNQSKERAELHGIQTRKFPIIKGQVLNIDHVVQVLSTYMETQDWKKAVLIAMSNRDLRKLKRRTIKNLRNVIKQRIQKKYKYSDEDKDKENKES